MTDSRIHTNVMRRVRTAYYLERVLSGMTLAALVFLAALYFIGREVWVAKVFENMPSITEAAAFSTFFLNAFLSTDHFVQFLLVLALAAGVLLLREAGRVVLVRPRFA